MMHLNDVDRTRAFTDEEQEEVNKLPREKRLAYMERPNSLETMSAEDRQKHYQSQNYPKITYSKGNSPNPPHMRGTK